MKIRLRLCIHLLIALFAVFPASPNSLATQTAVLPTKSALPAVSSSVTTTTTEESVLRSGGEIGLSAECLGRAKAFHILPTGIPKFNSEIFAETGRTLAARAGAGAGDEMVDVYRAFGGDARAQGFSWTTVDPRTVSNFRDVAGLPSGGASGAMNTADFMIQGRASVRDVIKFKSADPLDGNIGGLPELIIDPKNVRLNDFSVLQP